MPARDPSTLVTFDLASLYLAGRLLEHRGTTATGLRPETCEAVRRALQAAPLGDGGAELLAAAGSGMPGALLPFRRCEWDILYAAHVTDSLDTSDGTLDFEGEGMRVDAGFFALARGSYRYLDTADPTRRTDKRLLPFAGVEAMLAALRADGMQHTRIEPCGEQGEALRIVGPWPARWFAARGGLGYRTLLSLRLVQPGVLPAGAAGLATPRMVTSAPIGETLCVLEDNALVLPKLSPELLMELQAAAYSGAWLLIQEARYFRFLAPLPDLLEPGAASHGWFHPSWLIGQALGLMPVHRVDVPRLLARELLAHFPWCWSYESADFIDLVRSKLPLKEPSS